MMRALLVVCLLVGAACRRESPKSDEPSTNEVIGYAKQGLAKLDQLAEQERRAAADKIAILDQTIREVEALVLAGNLDLAEMKAAGIVWHPDPSRSQISPSDKKLVEQYDEQRKRLLAVIDRKRSAP